MVDILLSLFESEEEKSQFLTLYNNNKDRMFRIAMKYLHNSADSEDAVHEAFLKIAEDKAKIYDISSNKQKAYLNILIRNISIKMFNKSLKTIVTDPEELFSDYNYETISLEDNVMSKISFEELVKYILLLPEGTRDAMVMKFFLDFPNSEIASQLGITENALRQRLFYARRELLKFINKGDNNE